MRAQPVLQLLVAAVGVALAAAPASAAKTSKNLLVTLDVAPDHAPGRVCVLSRYEGCAIKQEKETCPTKVSDLKPQAIVAGQDQFFLTTASSVGSNVNAVVEIVNSRRAALTDKCDASNLMCAPAIELRGYGTADDVNLWMTCSAQAGPSNRILFVSLQFPTSDNTLAAVTSVTLAGTTATLRFSQPLDTRIRTVVQVIGGDYAPQATTRIGVNESLTLSLVPRCQRVIAELPGMPPGGYDVGITSDGQDVLHSGSCKGTVAQAALSLVLPVTTPSELKSITASTVVNDGGRSAGPPSTQLPCSVGEAPAPRPSPGCGNCVEAKASWTTSVPTPPFRLAAHSFTFAWTKPRGCNEERWGTPEERSRPQPTWSLDCPRASLSDGSTCELKSDLADRCQYRCTVTSPAETLAFPTPIRFDRLRMHAEGTRTPETVYSWSDTLIYSGQTLESRVASADRRIMLEYEDRDAWRARMGLQYDEVRVVAPDGATSSQLLTVRDVPPSWQHMSVPGTCVTHVTVAVFGSGVYDEHREDVKYGVIRLHHPQHYRRRHRIDLEAGGFYQAQDRYQDGQLAATAGLVYTFEPGIPFGFGAFASVNLTEKSFIALHGIDEASEDEQVWIWRVKLGGVVEHWIGRRTRLFARGGWEIDSPFDYSDDTKLGISSASFPLELGAVLELARRRAWLSISGGVDFDVEHYRFETDFFGEPTPIKESRNEPFLAARLRARLR